MLIVHKSLRLLCAVVFRAYPVYKTICPPPNYPIKTPRTSPFALRPLPFILRPPIRHSKFEILNYFSIFPPRTRPLYARRIADMGSDNRRAEKHCSAMAIQKNTKFFNTLIFRPKTRIGPIKIRIYHSRHISDCFCTIDVLQVHPGGYAPRKVKALCNREAG